MKKSLMLTLTAITLSTAATTPTAQASGLEGRWTYESGPQSCPSTLTINISDDKRSATVHNGQELLKFSVESQLKPGNGFVEDKTTISNNRIVHVFSFLGMFGGNHSSTKRSFQKFGRRVTFTTEQADRVEGKSKRVCKYN